MLFIFDQPKVLTSSTRYRFHWMRRVCSTASRTTFVVRLNSGNSSYWNFARRWSQNWRGHVCSLLKRSKILTSCFESRLSTFSSPSWKRFPTARDAAHEVSAALRGFVPFESEWSHSQNGCGYLTLRRWRDAVGMRGMSWSSCSPNSDSDSGMRDYEKPWFKFE